MLDNNLLPASPAILFLRNDIICSWCKVGSIPCHHVFIQGYSASKTAGTMVHLDLGYLITKRWIDYSKNVACCWIKQVQII